MTEINLSNLSVDELEALKGSIDGVIELKQNEELMAIRNKLDELIDNSPYTLEEILAAKKVRKSVAPKYQNPNDASQTWTGRGRRPRWVEEHMAAGGTLSSVAI